MNNRTIKFNRWIPEQRITTDGGSKRVPGTYCWETDFPNEGVFHQWAAAYEESSEGFGNYTVALVELPDGTIEQVLPSNVKFQNYDKPHGNGE